MHYNVGFWPRNHLMLTLEPVTKPTPRCEKPAIEGGAHGRLMRVRYTVNFTPF